MRTVSPDALEVPTFPILTAELEAEDFREHFPIRTTALDPLVEAEPSEGALVRLKSGDVVHVTFGIKTGTLSVSAPADSNVKEILENLIIEARLNPKWITWSKGGRPGSLQQRRKTRLEKSCSRTEVILPLASCPQSEVRAMPWPGLSATCAPQLDWLEKCGIRAGSLAFR